MSYLEKKLLTLAFVVRGDRILLGMKKRGFGEGNWNGFGGKVQEGESLEEAMAREMEEEAGIRPLDPVSAGTLEFHYPSNGVIHEVHLFLIREFEGEPVETEEMAPQWFSVKEIPYEKMWEDDPMWLPLVLKGHTVRGTFLFNAEKRLAGAKIEIQRG